MMHKIHLYKYISLKYICPHNRCFIQYQLYCQYDLGMLSQLCNVIFMLLIQI